MCYKNGNRSVEIPSGSSISLARAPFSLRYASLDDDSFIGALREKLFWGVDKRNP